MLDYYSPRFNRVIEFNQKPWMKDFIDFNINRRKEFKNEFERGFFKIMCNATYGRTLMNLRKRQNISLINDATKLNDFVKKPNFISSKNIQRKPRSGAHYQTEVIHESTNLCWLLNS